MKEVDEKGKNAVPREVYRASKVLAEKGVSFLIRMVMKEERIGIGCGVACGGMKIRANHMDMNANF